MSTPQRGSIPQNQFFYGQQDQEWANWAHQDAFVGQASGTADQVPFQDPAQSAGNQDLALANAAVPAYSDTGSFRLPQGFEFANNNYFTGLVEGSPGSYYGTYDPSNANAFPGALLQEAQYGTFPTVPEHPVAQFNGRDQWTPVPPAYIHSLLR
jgi:hypothetical protein